MDNDGTGDINEKGPLVESVGTAIFVERRIE
jgi:hypothetical protein